MASNGSRVKKDFSWRGHSNRLFKDEEALMDKVKMAREQHVEKQKQVKKRVKSRDCVRIAEEGGKCVGMVEAE